MPNPQAITRKSWCGMGTEATAGTALTTPTLFIPAKSTVKFKQDEEIPDEERATVDEQIDRIPTTRHGEADPKGNWYMDTSPEMLYLWFGGETLTQPDVANAPTAWKHAFTLNDVPKTGTFFKSYHSLVYYMAYSMVEKWTLKFTAEKKLLEFESSLKGLFPVKYTGSVITPTFSTVKSIGGYAPTLNLGGSATTDISDLTITGERKLSMWYAPNGSQDFVRIDVGGRKVSVDFTARFDTDAVFLRYLAGSDDVLSLDVMGPVIGGAVHQELSMGIPVVAYSDMEQDTGKNNVLIKAKGIARSTAAGLITAYVVNTITDYNH